MLHVHMDLKLMNYDMQLYKLTYKLYDKHTMVNKKKIRITN